MPNVSLTRTPRRRRCAASARRHAHSAAAAGAREQHISSYELATAAPAAIQDEEERSIVAKTFGHVPAP